MRDRRGGVMFEVIRVLGSRTAYSGTDCEQRPESSSSRRICSRTPPSISSVAVESLSNHSGHVGPF